MSDLSSDSGSELVSDKERAQTGGALSLSSAQLGIWFAQKLNPSSPAYNIGEYIEIDGPIVLPLFERALRQVVAEAQSLRLQFSEQAGEPAQRVGEPTAWSLPIIDVSGEADARSAAEAWMKADLAQPVDPVRGPLFGFALFKASATRFFWYARYHHIVLDGFGMWLVARRVADVYTESLCWTRGATATRSARLRLCWTRTPPIVRPSNSTKDRQYWTDALAARPEPGSLDVQRSSVGPSGELPARDGVFAALMRRCAANIGCSRAEQRLLVSWRAATAILLHRLTGADDVVIGMPVAARERGRAAHPRHGLQRAAAASCGASGHDGVRTSSSRRRGRFAEACSISAISSRTCAGMLAAAASMAGRCSG